MMPRSFQIRLILCIFGVYGLISAFSAHSSPVPAESVKKWQSPGFPQLTYSFSRLNPDKVTPLYQFQPHIKQDCSINDFGMPDHLPVVMMGFNKAVINYSMGNSTLYSGVKDLETGEFYGPVVDSLDTTFFTQSASESELYGYLISIAAKGIRECESLPAVVTFGEDKQLTMKKAPEYTQGKKTGLLAAGKALAVYSYTDNSENKNQVIVVDKASNQPQYTFNVYYSGVGYGDSNIKYIQEGSKLLLIGASADAKRSDLPQPSDTIAVFCDLDKAKGCHPAPDLNNTQRYVGINAKKNSYILAYDHRNPLKDQLEICLYEVAVTASMNPEPLGQPLDCDTYTGFQSGELQSIRIYRDDMDRMFLQAKYQKRQQVFFYPEATYPSRPYLLTAVFPQLTTLFGEGVYKRAFITSIQGVKTAKGVTRVMGSYYVDWSYNIYDVGTFQLTIYESDPSVH